MAITLYKTRLRYVPGLLPELRFADFSGFVFFHILFSRGLFLLFGKVVYYHKGDGVHVSYLGLGFRVLGLGFRFQASLWSLDMVCVGWEWRCCWLLVWILLYSSTLFDSSNNRFLLFLLRFRFMMSTIFLFMI
jgi:hypothetical protein